MFPKKSRLPAAELGKVFTKTFSSPYFLLKSRKSAAPHNRFAVIIPNRAVQKAAKRHLFKRFFTRALALWPDMAQDYIIIASPRLGSATKEDLVPAIRNALESIQKQNGTLV